MKDKIMKDIEQTLQEVSKKLDQILIWQNEAKKPEPVVSKYPDNLMRGWVIQSTGHVENANMHLLWVVELIFDQDNWFATEAEAELEAKRRAVIQKMRAYGFKPDWKDEAQTKYSITYNNNSSSFSADDWCNQGQGLFEIYFETREKAQERIDVLGDEILEVL